MSANALARLHRQISSGEIALAIQSAPAVSGEQSVTFADYAELIQHALGSREPDLAVALLEAGRRFFAPKDDGQLRDLVAGVTTLLAASWRLKMEEPARKSVGLILELLASRECPVTDSGREVVMRFAGWAGRFALWRNDLAWFGEIAMQVAEWSSRDLDAKSGELFLPAVEAWLYRILRHGRIEAIPILFDAVSVVYDAEKDKNFFSAEFLKEWRSVAAIACLDRESMIASRMVEQLLLFTIRSGSLELWSPVTERISEVAALAVSKHGITDAFPVFRPMLDVARTSLGDELKFGTGPDPESVRQQIIRLICCEAVWIAEMAVQSDFSSLAGDKLEEMFLSWVQDPQYESQTRSIQRYCQLLLIFWSNNRKRAARKWTPREKHLSEPLLLTEEDQTKLTFLL